MMQFIHSLVSVFILALFIVVPSAQGALNAFDRQEFTFENALADKNPGFESGVTQWTASGGTFVSNSGTQIVPNSKQYATWDSNSASQTLQTSAVTVPKTGNCEFSIWIAVPSGTATHTITVTDGSNDLVTAQTITNNTNALKHIVNFPCPASGTVRGKLTSVNSNEPSIGLDNARLGSATNVGTAGIISEWQSFTPTGSWTGSVTYTGRWRQVGNNAEFNIKVALGGAPTGAGLNFTLPFGWVIDTSKLASVNANGHTLFGTASILDNGTRIYDTAVIYVSTTVVGLQTKGQAVTSIDYNGSPTPTLPMTFASGDTVDAFFSVPIMGFASSTTVIPNAQGLSWSGTHGQDCSWTTTSTSLAAIGTGDATCTFTQLSNKNFGTVASATASSNNIPGIVFTPVVSGRYFVCVTAHAYNVTTVGNFAGLAIHDGTSTISFASRRNGNATTGTNDEIPFSMCGIATMSAGASRTIQLYANASAGTTTLGSGSSGVASVSWSIFNVDQPVQALIANSVIARDAVNGQVTTVNTVVSKSTTYTATANDETISASMSGGAWTLSLPAAASVRGKKYHIYLPDDSANGLTIDPNSTETICGQTTVVLRGPRDSMVIQSDGTNWMGLDESCWRIRTAKIDCDSSSSNLIDRQYTISSIGNISGGTCSVTLNSGTFSGTPELIVSWYGSGASSGSDFYGVCTSSTSCVLGGPGTATTAQLNVIWRGPR